MLNKMLQSRNKKGFTLMEMLIVVAIIAILVAISIPVFSSQLETARKATDDANVRAAKAVAAVSYLSEGQAAGTYKYDAVEGELATSVTTGYGKTTDNKDKVVQVVLDDEGSITTSWVAAG